MSTARRIAKTLIPGPHGLPPDSNWHQGVVTAIAVGPPPTVSVKIGGTATATAGLRFMATYSPAVNDTVWVLTIGRDNIVWGSLAGTGGGGGGIPSGSLEAFAGAAAPAGWLLCNGQAVSRATYAALFAAIGTTYGVGDGSTTFNVPDLRDRFPIGVNTHGLGAAGGSLGAVNTGIQNNNHTHTLTGATSGSQSVHTHGIPSGSGGSGSTSQENLGHVHVQQGATFGVSADHAHPTTDAAPYLAVNWIVKT